MASTTDKKEETAAHGKAGDHDFHVPQYAPESKMANEGNQAVRFASKIEEIAPEQTLSSLTSDNAETQEDDGPTSPALLRELSKSLQGANLQERRMNIFSFEAFSLPPSRTQSHEDESPEMSGQHGRGSSSRPSPMLGPRGSDAQTPPLTPSASGAVSEETSKQTDGAEDVKQSPGPVPGRPDVITPQRSTQDIRSPASSEIHHRLASVDEIPRRPSSAGGRRHESEGQVSHRKGMFSTGTSGGGGSLPASREASPSRAAASQFYARPFTPSGDANDPYAAAKRQPQNKIEQRFVFSRKNKQPSPSSSTMSIPKVSQDKRHSGLLGHLKHGIETPDDHSPTPTLQSRQNSQSDLRRFFKMGPHHKAKRPASPAPSVKAGAKTPPGGRSPGQIPFDADHGLTSKYGKLGRVLGAGAGGSVRLMKRSEDGVVFAVKQFRARHTYETEREYVKKVTAEYCIGSSLHHGNIIETLDIVQERGQWYEVMEYAPFDLFAIVMTGRQTREEVACCFLQILSGVTYLHSSGLAHRDLKLDNVVVSDAGIMKIIDFGSAHVFRYPFENGVVKATGIVGSDPYLAPEVYEEKKYDAEAVDIWSLAIIFCCMSLRRFPWKIPRLTDSSFKLFASEPTPGHDPKKLILPAARSTGSLNKIPPRDMVPGPTQERHSHSHSHEHDAQSDYSAAAPTSATDGGEKKEVIKGPWRILRLLPRESRHVIGRMLEIDPKNRAKMEEILQDSWVADTVICRQIEPGLVVQAEDHKHVLEPPAPSNPAK